MKENEPIDRPGIISDLNMNLKPAQFTVEGIAEKIGISKKILYEWVRTDDELTGALDRLKNLQEGDPFESGIPEDAWVGSMTLTLILMEARDRHFKPRNN
jgi:hypothetical protein